MATIVCFGDSNTYGTPGMSEITVWGRHAPHERWPGILAATLGRDWRVIEEGLPGRTTVHDDPIEGAHMNGLKALPMVLGSHRPIDWLVIALGCNDLKARFSVTPEDIAASAGLLATTALQSQAGLDGRPPKILLVSPSPIIETGCLAGMFCGAEEKSKALGSAYAAVAKRLGVAILDAAEVVQVDTTDGVHLAVDQHALLGRAVAEALRAN